MIDCGLALICGTDIPLENAPLIVHQPMLKEISLVGEKTYFNGAQTLCVQKSMINQGESVLSNLTNFQVFMMIMTEKDPDAQEKKRAVQQIAPLLFPSYKLMITPQSIILMGPDNTSVILDDTNFEELQQVINQVCCFTGAHTDQQNFNPGNAKAKEIADKLMRGRQRVAAQQENNGGSSFSQYISTLTVGLQMDIDKVSSFTLYQLYDIMERYGLYLNWDLDVRTRLAGGKPDSQPDNWMKKIH